jgi:hypothetical protein
MAKRPGLTQVSWTGLDELMASLQTLAPDLAAEANNILLAGLQDAKTAIDAAYPFHTGNLKRGLVIRPAVGPTKGGATLVQTAPHGGLYEFGTKLRTNKAGQNRGASPKHPTFIPIAAAHQKTALAAVVARLYAHGAASVTGDVEPVATRRTA